jgi:hypothetical protein
LQGDPLAQIDPVSITCWWAVKMSCNLFAARSRNPTSVPATTVDWVRHGDMHSAVCSVHCMCPHLLQVSMDAHACGLFSQMCT